MKREDITRPQAKIIAEAVRPSVACPYRLRQRLEEVGFPDTDSYYQLVCLAYASTHALWIQTHYLSCEGAGRPSESTKPGSAPTSS